MVSCFLFGTFLNFLHEEVHLGTEHVHFAEGMDSSFLGLEAFLIPSLVDNHFLNEVLSILDFLLQECASSCYIKLTTGYTGQSMVETLNEEPFLYPMMRTGPNVLLKTWL
jgi:hypothetical protein